MRILIIFSLLFLLGCKTNEPIVDSEPSSKNPLELIWKTVLTNDTSLCSSIYPILYDGLIVISGEKFGSPEADVLKVVNSDGDEIWNTEVSGGICNSFNESDGSGNYVYQGMFLYMCSGVPSSLNMYTGNVIWELTDGTNTGNNLSSYGESLFYSVRYAQTGPSKYDSSKLYIVNVLSGDSRDFYRVGKTNGQNPNLYPPEVNINEYGDTILYFQNRQWNMDSSWLGGKVDLYAYNLTKDSLEWLVESIDPYGNSSTCRPFYHDDKIYFRCFRSLHCLDANTGESLWIYEFPNYWDNLHLGNMLIESGILIVKSSNDAIHAFDPNSGNLIWEKREAGITSCYMKAYDGAVYYGSYDGYLRKVNATNGEVEWKILSPNHGVYPTWDAEFTNAVVIDPDTKRLYTTDGYFIMCFQLN